MVMVTFNRGVFECTGIQLDEESNMLIFYSYGQVGCSVMLNRSKEEQYAFLNEQIEAFKQGRDIRIGYEDWNI